MELPLQPQPSPSLPPPLPEPCSCFVCGMSGPCVAELDREWCPKGWALPRHSPYLLTPAQLFWHPESSQTKRCSAETGFHGEVFGNPISTRARECSLRTSALLCRGCCKQGTGTLCYTQGPRTAQGKQTFANPALCLGSSTRAFTSRLPSHACPWCLPSGKLGCPEPCALCVLIPHRVPLCSCDRQGARVL